MQRLTDDLHIHIFSFLDISSLRWSACTQSSWRTLAMEEDSLWKPLCEARWKNWQNRFALLGMSAPKFDHVKNQRNRRRRDQIWSNEPVDANEEGEGEGEAAREENHSASASSIPTENAAKLDPSAASVDEDTSMRSSPPPEPSVPLTSSPYAPYLHLPWHIRYLLAELDRYRVVISAQELCNHAWRFTFQSDLFQDANMSSVFYPQFLADHNFESDHFDATMTWRLVERFYQTQSNAKKRKVYSEDANAHTQQQHRSSPMNDEFKERDMEAENSSPENSEAAAPAVAEAVADSAAAPSSSSSSSVSSSSGAVSSRRKSAIISRLRQLLPSFFDNPRPAPNASSQPIFDESSQRIRAYFPHLSNTATTQPHYVAPENMSRVTPEYPSQAELFALDESMVRSVQVQQYPFLVVSRTDDAGFQMVNPFVIFASIDPSIDPAAEAAENIVRQAEILERRRRMREEMNAQMVARDRLMRDRALRNQVAAAERNNANNNNGSNNSSTRRRHTHSPARNSDDDLDSDVDDDDDGFLDDDDLSLDDDDSDPDIYADDEDAPPYQSVDGDEDDDDDDEIEEGGAQYAVAADVGGSDAAAAADTSARLLNVIRRTNPVELPSYSAYQPLPSIILTHDAAQVGMHAEDSPLLPPDQPQRAQSDASMQEK